MNGKTSNKDPTAYIGTSSHIVSFPSIVSRLGGVNDLLEESGHLAFGFPQAFSFTFLLVFLCIYPSSYKRGRFTPMACMMERRQGSIMSVGFFRYFTLFTY